MIERTKIFLDSGDPKETAEMLHLLGVLDGQTTNPTLIAKSPEALARKERGETFSQEELSEYYKKTVQEISTLLPAGSVSIEIYADHSTPVPDMLAQAREFNTWIPNAHIKFPTTTNGIMAAQQALEEGMRVNMTLVFSQAQAAAVYAATKGARRGDVYLSPFIGRLDDIGLHGMDVIRNIQTMYADGDGHVEVLAASIRSTDHMRAIIGMNMDIATAPGKVLTAWAQGDQGSNAPVDLQPIPYEKIALNQDWKSFNISHELTIKGLERFAKDWNDLMA